MPIKKDYYIIENLLLIWDAKISKNIDSRNCLRILEGGGGKRPGDEGDVRETRKKAKVDYTEEKVHSNKNIEIVPIQS